MTGQGDVAVMARRIAAFGLPGHEDTIPFPIADDRWPALVATLTQERCTGLAVAAAESGWLQLSPEQLRDLFTRHREAMVQVLGMERKLLVLANALDQASVGFVLLKGASLARSVYPNPSWRAFGDLDVLVQTGDWRRACSVLRDVGFPRALPEPRPGFDERFGKASVHRGEGGMEVDLHRTLVLGPFGLWIEPDRLFDHTVGFEMGGRVFHRFDDTMLLLHACVHASLGWWPPLLLPVRDVAQIAWFGKVDWSRFMDQTLRWRLGAVVQDAFRTVEGMLETAMPEQAKSLVELRPPRRERRALLAYTTERRARGGMARATLQAIPGLRRKVTYVYHLLFPSRQFLAARAGAGQSSYWRRWRVAANWLGHRRVQR
jgi:putative nucleotidyltransferase-like protein